MSTIGIIDDRDEDRANLVDGINLAKEDEGWIVVQSKPLESLDEYPAWISENKICALVIDEMLSEELKNGEAVEYEGHDLVSYIRMRFKTLPIFVVTAHKDEPELQNKFKDVEDIIDRADYGMHYPNYVPRIIRAAQQYLNIFQEELNKLSDYARKVAVGDTLNIDDQATARAIQTKLDLAYSIEPIQDMSNWIEEASVLINNLEALRKEIEKNTGGDDEVG